MSCAHRKVITSLVLVALLMVVFFSFAAMAHSDEGSMQGNCPFSVVGEAVCPQNLAAATVHHISAYQSFLAVLIGSGVSAVIALLLLLGAVLLFLLSPLLFKPPERVRHFFYSSPATPQDYATIRWLSLLENSPSIA